MSAVIDGDRPRRRRAPKAIESMGIEVDFGELKGRVSEHEKRMDRTDAAYSKQFELINARFGSIDGKLDTLILQTAKEEGAQEHEKNAEESQISFWAKWSGFAIVAGTVADILQPVFGWVKHIITGH